MIETAIEVSGENLPASVVKTILDAGRENLYMKLVSLPGSAATFVAGGGRDIDTAKLGAELAPGEHVRIEQSHGSATAGKGSDEEMRQLEALGYVGGGRGDEARDPNQGDEDDH